MYKYQVMNVTNGQKIGMGYIELRNPAQDGNWIDLQRDDQDDNEKCSDMFEVIKIAHSENGSDLYVKNVGDFLTVIKKL